MVISPGEQQVAQLRETARKSGCGGTLWLDLDPEGGFLRLKLTGLQNLSPRQLIGIFAEVLSQAAAMVNLEVKRYDRSKPE